MFTITVKVLSMAKTTIKHVKISTSRRTIIFIKTEILQTRQYIHIQKKNIFNRNGNKL